MNDGYFVVLLIIAIYVWHSILILVNFKSRLMSKTTSTLKDVSAFSNRSTRSPSDWRSPLLRSIAV